MLFLSVVLRFLHFSSWHTFHTIHPFLVQYFYFPLLSASTFLLYQTVQLGQRHKIQVEYVTDRNTAYLFLFPTSCLLVAIYLFYCSIIIPRHPHVVCIPRKRKKKNQKKENIFLLLLLLLPCSLWICYGMCDVCTSCVLANLFVCVCLVFLNIWRDICWIWIPRAYDWLSEKKGKKGKKNQKWSLNMTIFICHFWLTVLYVIVILRQQFFLLLVSFIFMLSFLFATLLPIVIFFLCVVCCWCSSCHWLLVYYCCCCFLFYSFVSQ